MLPLGPEKKGAVGEEGEEEPFWVETANCRARAERRRLRGLISVSPIPHGGAGARMCLSLGIPRAATVTSWQTTESLPAKPAGLLLALPPGLHCVALGTTLW